MVCSQLGRGGASKKPHAKQVPAEPQKSTDWYQMDANEAKWDTASNEVVLGRSTMSGWVLGSYSKRRLAAFMQEYDELLAIRPCSRQKSTHDSPDKILRCNARERRVPRRGGRQEGG